MAGKRKAGLRDIEAELRSFARTFPGAWSDEPWGEHVTKVGKKIFAFHGMVEGEADKVSLGVKLTDENEHALTHAWCTPTGYGLGRAGWVSCRFDATTAEPPPVEILKEWIDESYRNVAPKKLIKELDALIWQT
jgi:predicted DNA-binding protein (MmcQ/YjbR family)